MSSNERKIENTNIAESSLIEEFRALLKTNKTIIPFAREHFFCQSLFNKQDIVYLDLSNYSAVEHYSSQDQIITVQTGIKIKALQNFLFEEKKFFPSAAYDNQTSLLDTILSGETGVLDQSLGGLSRYILGMDCLLGTGELVKCGGKVVKNVSGYDLTRFFVGSYGYFVVPIRAHLRLSSLPEQNLTILIEGNDRKELLDSAKEIKSINLPLSYLELVDSRLMEKTEKFQFKERFLLVLRVFGDQLAIKIGLDAISNILSNKMLKQTNISDPLEQEYFLTRLSQISWFTNKTVPGKQKAARVIDLSVKSNDLIILMTDSKLASFPFVYKALPNRLRFCLDSVLEQNILLEHLNTFSSDNKLALSAAYADDTHIRRVEFIGYDTNSGDHLNTIKKRLKSKFDPNNLLNPYVDL